MFWSGWSSEQVFRALDRLPLREERELLEQFFGEDDAKTLEEAGERMGRTVGQTEELLCTAVRRLTALLREDA